MTQLTTRNLADILRRMVFALKTSPLPLTGCASFCLIEDQPLAPIFTESLLGHVQMDTLLNVYFITLSQPQFPRGGIYLFKRHTHINLRGGLKSASRAGGSGAGNFQIS